MESEIHFVFQCAAYELIRNTFLNALQSRNQNFMRYDEAEKMKYIMSHLDTEVGYYSSLGPSYNHGRRGVFKRVSRHIYLMNNIVSNIACA